MLSITFLGKGKDFLDLFWIFLAIGVTSLAAFFIIEKRTKIPLINLKLAFHRIIRVGNISYLMLGVVQYIIFSTIPTLGQTVEPYGLGLNTLQVGYLQLPQALVFVAAWSYCRDDGHKTRKPEIYRSWFNNTSRRYRCTLSLSRDFGRGCTLAYSVRSWWGFCNTVCQCHHLLYTS